MDRLQVLSQHLCAEPPAGNLLQVEANGTSAQSETDPVLYEALDGNIALITLNRPDRLNALTNEMQAAYFDALDRADADPKVHVVVVTGSGRGFCAGAGKLILLFMRLNPWCFDA